MVPQELRLKMIDITPYLSSLKAWKASEAVELVNRIKKSFPNTRVDWDEGAGENWISVISDGVKLAVININVRFAIVLSGSTLKEELRPYVTYIEISTWHEPRLKVDESLVKMLSGRDKISQNVRLDQISADDLWWATI